MTEYVAESLTKSEQSESAVQEALKGAGRGRGGEHLTHGAWINRERAQLKKKRFSTPVFALLFVFFLLYVGSLYLFESMDILDPMLYTARVAISSLFAVSLGFILSIWWSAGTRFDDKLKEAERIDGEYRELLISFADSLFDIINALNTLASHPQKPFIVATEFLLGEYVHMLQSQLQRYGDYIAALGFDASDFLDEKMRIFEGIRERASLSIEGMPKELERLFVRNLNLDIAQFSTKSAEHQAKLRRQLEELSEPGEEVPAS